MHILACVFIFCGPRIGRIMRFADPSVCLSICRIRARNSKTKKKRTKKQNE